MFKSVFGKKKNLSGYSRRGTPVGTWCCSLHEPVGQQGIVSFSLLCSLTAMEKSSFPSITSLTQKNLTFFHLSQEEAEWLFIFNVSRINKRTLAQIITVFILCMLSIFPLSSMTPSCSILFFLTYIAPFC